MARKKKSSTGGLRGDEWLATYSDCITLLLTFFILLYSMSTVDAQKLQQLSSAFNEVMTGKEADSILQYNLYNGNVPLVGGEVPGEGTETYEGIKQFLSENDLSTTVEMTEDERGVILQLRDSILFEPGKAELIPDSIAVLDKISVLISNLNNSIIVEGHTDNVPHHSYDYASNWELSGTRATTVLRYFVDGKGLDPTRFNSAGYGEYRPLVANTSEENKAKNRRVNILIVANNKE